jgi:hypothetical protein
MIGGTIFVNWKEPVAFPKIVERQTVSYEVKYAVVIDQPQYRCADPRLLERNTFSSRLVDIRWFAREDKDGFFEISKEPYGG